MSDEPERGSVPDLVTRSYIAEQLKLKSVRSVANLKLHDPDFPKPVPPGNLTVYDKAEVDAYVRRRRGQNDDVPAVPSEGQAPEVVGFAYVGEQMGVSLKTAHRRVAHAEGFPARVNPGEHHPAWLKSEVDAWLLQLKLERLERRSNRLLQGDLHGDNAAGSSDGPVR